jgi:hypothetical protein
MKDGEGGPCKALRQQWKTAQGGQPDAPVSLPTQGRKWMKKKRKPLFYIEMLPNSSHMLN